MKSARWTMFADWHNADMFAVTPSGHDAIYVSVLHLWSGYRLRLKLNCWGPPVLAYSPKQTIANTDVFEALWWIAVWRIFLFLFSLFPSRGDKIFHVASMPRMQRFVVQVAVTFFSQNQGAFHVSLTTPLHEATGRFVVSSGTRSSRLSAFSKGWFLRVILSRLIPLFRRLDTRMKVLKLFWPSAENGALIWNPRFLILPVCCRYLIVTSLFA